MNPPPITKINPFLAVQNVDSDERHEIETNDCLIFRTPISTSVKIFTKLQRINILKYAGT